MEGKKIVVLKGVTLYWSFLNTRNDLSGKYQVDLSLNDKQVEGLERHGVNVRNKGDDKGDFVTAKSALYPIPTLDENNQAIGEGVAVGNGTIADVKVTLFPWEHKPTKRSGIGVGATEVRIKKMVEYSGSGGEPDEVLGDDVGFEDLEEEEL